MDGGEEYLLCCGWTQDRGVAMQSACHIISCRVVSCRAVSYRIVSYSTVVVVSYAPMERRCAMAADADADAVCAVMRSDVT